MRCIWATGNLPIGEVDEIELSEGFFNYEEKYTLKTSNIYVPARIPLEKAEEIRHMAAVIYRALKCRDFARVDMFLTPEGKIYFNEVNTIPGFTRPQPLSGNDESGRDFFPGADQPSDRDGGVNIMKNYLVLVNAEHPLFSPC